ncbi:USP9_24 [Lepeophtheirus salmonis]|uniref:USP9_24 n=1 Tax=Lepeophtheirus salmonis TaxID=72036 RepID=A0A7R8CLV0_LEPSM|nr:USP9_24 [Lepeophtheirus salmonis]CAF2826099.1 USP9_24 [Lepeophtheirus salmonis]
MSEHSFKNTISRLMKIIWAASAGKLNLASSSISTMNRATISENVLYSDKRRSRESSTGSSSSEDNASSSSSVLDAQIASDAFELLVTSLSLRIHEITLFYDLPLVDEFIVDTVLGSPSRSVRQKARDQLIRFSKIPYVRRKIFSSDNSNGPIPSPKSFLTQVLLKTPVPLWMPSCKARGTSHIILSQCSEYFELRCSLMRDLTLEDQKTLLSEPASQMLDDELSFLYNYTPCHRLSDCNLLAGHLKLVEALLTCDGVNKARIASRIIVDDSNSSRPINPKCDTRDSRIAAYQLLIELTKGCPSNMKIISDELIVLHHQSHHHRDDIGKDFEYEPDVERRKEFVGLKNAGATCYMNSVLQQLYSIPGIADAILSENKDEDSDKEEESIFHQLQVVFGYLLESKLKFYSPETFWKCFKLFGRPVNVREQQDAFEFFTQIVSQVDDYLSLNKRNKVFAPRLEGIFSDQKICQGCPHRYEREQMFTALNLPVTTNNLVESLDQFVKGELLEGDNAYYCEKCGTKRNAIKRMCIRSCPSTLVIQLKRFHYDWESNRALKFDDYFQFPMKLDMGPYTSDGIRQKNKNDKKKKATSPCSILYDLCGVVVHSGQASAGHYYSFVRKRKSNGKWYKFNDTTVEEFELNEESLVAECFGGNYTEKKSSHLPEERLRYWNAYMLFYEALRFSSLSASQSPGTNAPLSAPPLSRESFSHLNDLLEHGERSGLFSQSLKMPNSIERSIREKNLKFLRDRDLFCPEYFKFVQDLIKINSCEVQSVKLAVHFLFNGYLHLKRRDSDLIQGFIRTILSQSSDSNSSLWLLQYLANHQQLFRLYLLECPCKSIRTHFSNIVYHVISSRNDQTKMLLIIRKTQKNLFWLLWKYSQLGLEHCQDLFESGTFRYTVKFLLGMDPLERNLSVITRKWSSSQIREFSELHSLIALLIHICDTSPFISFASSPQLREQSFKFRMPESVQSVLYGDLAPMYVREVVTAVRENIGDPEHLSKMLLGSSYCCERFSFILLEELLKQYSNVNSSELKHLSNLIIDLLDIEDFLQFKRIKYVIEGDSSSDGFLSLIPIYRDSDSRRAYQCIKTLVNSANKSSHVKNFLLIEETAEKWEEAVRWLQSRMVDFNGNGGASGGESSNISTSSYPVSTVLPSSSSTIVSSTSEPVSDIFSNEDSSTRTFRRTTSAQVTLEEANALMAHYGSTSNMEIEEEHMKTDEEC